MVGGAERKLFGIKDVLERHGHQVEVFVTAHPDNRPARFERHFPPYRDMSHVRFDADGVRIAIDFLYSRPARRGLAAVLQEFEPDVVLVNTWEHHLSHSVLLELRSKGVPVVSLLSDFQAICPNTFLVRDGETCTRCFGGKYYHALLGRCVKDSFAASALAMCEGYLHKARHVYEIPELLLALNDDAAKKLAQGGG